MQDMTFAEKLQKLRKQNGLSQEQPAEKLWQLCYAHYI